METELMNQQRDSKPLEAEVFFQWGKRKRLRCARIKDPEISERLSGGLRKRIASQIDRCVLTVSENERTPFQSNRLSRNFESATVRKSAAGTAEIRKSSSPEKQDRYYPTRGPSVSVDENTNVGIGVGEDRRCFVWPKLFISLSSKEKEEDFMAMKGCKLPQRPKKRAKLVQRSLLLVSPGAWLNDMNQERYEVREKKSAKKRARGLKAMGNLDSDSE